MFSDLLKYDYCSGSIMSILTSVILGSKSKGSVSVISVVEPEMVRKVSPKLSTTKPAEASTPEQVNPCDSKFADQLAVVAPLNNINCTVAISLVNQLRQVIS